MKQKIYVFRVFKDKLRFKVKKKVLVLKETQQRKQKSNLAFFFKRKANLTNLNLERKRLAKLKMSPDCFQVLTGSLLGDGSLKIHKGYKNARYAVRHAIASRAYFEWKIEKLKELASDKCVNTQLPSKGSYGKTNMLRFQTLTNTELTLIHSIVTKNNKMNIKRQWLNHLSPLALAVWWCDDGCLQDNWTKGVFCSEGFSKKENFILATYLRVVWGVKARVVPRRIFKSIKKDIIDLKSPPGNPTFGMVTLKDPADSWVGYRIKMSTQELRKFLRIILPYIPVKEMIYKVCMIHNNKALQQRWISEIKENLPQFEQAIDDFYANKKKPKV